MSTLGDHPISRVELTVPEFGGARGDVVLVGAEAPPVGPAVLAVGDLEMHVTIVFSGLDAAGKPHASVVSGAGWEEELTAPMSYQSDGGVRLSTVLADLSRRAGQAIDQPPDRTIRERFAASAGVCHRDVLAALRRSGFVGPWRVDADGVTRFGARARAAVSSRATEMRRDSALGIITLGIDAPASFLPGAVLETGETIKRVVFRETAGKLEADAWVSDSSLRSSVLRMVASAFPALVYGYPRTYQVAEVLDDGRLDLVPPPDARHLPELESVEQWSTGGALVTPKAGAEVLVVFRDADPTRYVVAGWAPGAVDKIELAGGDREAAAAGEEEGKGIAYGDTVMMFLGSAMTPTPLKLMRTGSVGSLAGDPAADVSKVVL